MRSHPDWRKGPRGDLSDPLAPLFLWLVGSLSIELCVVVDTEQRMAGSGMAEVSSRWLFLCGPSVLLDQCLQFLRLQFGALGMQFGLTAQGYAVDGR